MGDNNNVNVWGLRPHPIRSHSRRKPSTFIDAKMQQTLKEHLDIYIKNIHSEDTDNFWTWFMDMWRLKSRLDCMGGYDTKEEIDHFNHLVAMEAECKSDSASSASEGTTSGSSSMTTIPSDVVGANDSHETDTTLTLQRRRAGLELHRKAVNRITVWCGVILATSTNPALEWECINVDAWVEVTGYDGKWLPK
ncbi:hypothetical protein ARMGADRAFT_1091820 [Armillaria gallica]|uniref:Uncharacterized protein n=1 Tax=Armillaria gallica TaxID=47427 RepID=A0A2H3CNL0_ARMGA|nr:hypothetical protein ARMGADRAFT_1091820 [Armillaria gallica]